MAEPYDLLLKGGDLVDPSQDLQQRCDVAFRDGRVAALASDLPSAAAQEVILLGVMSTFLALEMPLAAVISRVTNKAATAIGKSPELGTLRVGSVGDAAVLDLQQGEFTFVDAVGNQVQSGQRLAPVLTVKHGRRWRRGSV